MKKLLLVGILLCSCIKKERTYIDVIRISSSLSTSSKKNNLATDIPSSEHIEIEIKSNEPFSKVNSKMNFGIHCVKNSSLLDGELQIFDVVKLSPCNQNHYTFYLNQDFVKDIMKNECFYCYFRRPGYLFMEGYQSSVFKLSPTDLKLQVLLNY